MKFQSKLPRTFPESLKLKPKDPGTLVKARTHERKAEELRDQARDAAREQEKDADEAPEGPRPHLEFLERWKALEHTVTPIAGRARHEWLGKLGTEPKPHQVIGHLIASLPRPRLDSLFSDPRIATLNVALHKRRIQKIVESNELLQDLGITWKTFVEAKRDLKFQLGLQSYKSAQALACYLSVIRAACDPKVRKTHNLVTDGEVLQLAGDVLRDVTTHIIEEMQNAHDTFFSVGDRQQVGEEFRLERAKKSGRPAPPANAPKGRPLPPTAPNKPNKPLPGSVKA
jgi:hypothetical protein